MKQKQHCLGILAGLGILSAMRAFWVIVAWLFVETSVQAATVFYSVLSAVGIWWAWFAARRIPTG